MRCAIDAQESLRTGNMAYPPSRHMRFRIGTTIGDDNFQVIAVGTFFGRVEPN